MDKKYTLLIVEDETSQRMLYKEYFEMENFNVLTAADGQEALDVIAKEKHIDMVLLDLMLPKIDGVKVLEKIRSNPETKNLIVYMMTVLDRDAVIKKAYDLDADGYLIKGAMNPDQIKTEVLNALNNPPRKPLQ
jgi:two-component system sensor histidine kinase/response regulator